MVKMSEANPASKGYPEIVNVGETREQGWRDVGISKQEQQNVVSVVLVVVGRGVVAAGPHSSAAIGLRLKTLYAFPLGRC